MDEMNEIQEDRLRKISKIQAAEDYNLLKTIEDEDNAQWERQMKEELMKDALEGQSSSVIEKMRQQEAMDLLPDGHPAKDDSWDPVTELNFDDHDPRVNF